MADNSQLSVIGKERKMLDRSITYQPFESSMISNPTTHSEKLIFIKEDDDTL